MERKKGLGISCLVLSSTTVVNTVMIVFLKHYQTSRRTGMTPDVVLYIISDFFAVFSGFNYPKENGGRSDIYDRRLT